MARENGINSTDEHEKSNNNYNLNGRTDEEKRMIKIVDVVVIYSSRLVVNIHVAVCEYIVLRK